MNFKKYYAHFYLAGYTKAIFDLGKYFFITYCILIARMFGYIC